jgi:cell wall-associated NlpC family hydrolase
MNKSPLTACLTALLLTACTQAPEPADDFDTDVIGIAERHLSADFWLSQARQADALLMDSTAIAAFNADAFARDDTMVALTELPAELPGALVHEMISGISKRSSYDRFLPDGRALNDADYATYAAALNLDALPETITPEFGLIVRRTDMRTFPTLDRVISGESSADLDRFQEHGLFPGEAVAILHQSADGGWLFVQSYNYAAWIEKDHVATGSRDEVLGFVAETDFLLVTGSKVHTNYDPQLPAVSEVQLDMGVRLPVFGASKVGHNLRGQNPYASHVVQLPTRTADGGLQFEYALIARSQDVRRGYLPYTRGNVIRQAFKFLGERYGWGHSYNGRDCTGFVSEVYKTFGIFMPRNSGDQGSSVIGDNARFADDTSFDDKRAVVDKLQIGALLYLPGHVAMYIGEDNGEPYIIHDVAGLSYIDGDDNYYRGLLHGVSVTPLLPLRLNEETRYLDRIYNIKTIR